MAEQTTTARMAVKSNASDKKHDEEKPSLSSTTDSLVSEQQRTPAAQSISSECLEAPKDPTQSYETKADLEFNDNERRKIVRRLDKRLLIVICVMYISIQTDRSNMGNALTDGFLPDLKLTSSDYNNGLLLTRIMFMLSEMPVQCLVVRYSFRNVFSVALLLWGIASIFQAFVTGRTSFYVTRAIIGSLEGGFMPGVTYYMTQFYTTSELTPRIAFMSSCQDLAMVVAGLLAAGILKLRGLGGKPGWFWLFVVEGAMVFLTGIFAYLWLPKSPYETTSKLCRKPWFNERELAILDYRLVTDDPSKRRSGEKARVPKARLILSTFRDSHLWCFFLLSTLAVMLHTPMKAYLNITLRRMGFSIFKSNVLGIPAALVNCFTVLLVSLSSEYFHERTFHCLFAVIWTIPCYIALVALTPADGALNPSHVWGRYALATLIAGSPTMYPILLSWISALSSTTPTRATNIASVSTLALLGAVISTQMYAERDQPYYRAGNEAEIVLGVVACGVLVVQRVVFQRLNRRNAVSGEQGGCVEQASGQVGREDAEVGVEMAEPVRGGREQVDSGVSADHEKRLVAGYKFPI